MLSFSSSRICQENQEVIEESDLSSPLVVLKTCMIILDPSHKIRASSLTWGYTKRKIFWDNNTGLIFSLDGADFQI